MTGRVETIEAEIHGELFRKRTNKGKRFIAYAQAEGQKADVATFSTAERAEDWGFWMRDRYDCEAHGFAMARVVSGGAE